MTAPRRRFRARSKPSASSSRTPSSSCASRSSRSCPCWRPARPRSDSCSPAGSAPRCGTSRGAAARALSGLGQTGRRSERLSGRERSRSSSEPARSSSRKTHGTCAAGRVQLAARLLPRDDRADRPARSDQRVRRSPELPRSRRAEGRHRPDRLVPAGLGRLGVDRRARCRVVRGRLGSVRSDGLGRQGGQPNLRPVRDAAVLEGEADLDRPRARLGARDRGSAPPDRARRDAR